MHSIYPLGTATLCHHDSGEDALANRNREGTVNIKHRLFPVGGSHRIAADIILPVGIALSRSR